MGSSNLTQQGLFANIESSILLEIENNNERDYDIIIKLKKYYTIIENDDDPNLYVLNDHLINDLVNKKLLPTKLEMIKEIRRSTLEKEISKDAYGKRAVPKIPSFLKTVSSYVRKVIQFRENGTIENLDSLKTFSIAPRFGTLWWYDYRTIEINNQMWKFDFTKGHLILTKYLPRDKAKETQAVLSDFKIILDR